MLEKMVPRFRGNDEESVGMTQKLDSRLRGNDRKRVFLGFSTTC
jgi:hypothetical protein